MKFYGGSRKKKPFKSEKNFSDKKPSEYLTVDGGAEPEEEFKFTSTEETITEGPKEGRTKEELEEIEALIAGYQKYKRRKRMAIFTVLLTVIICSYFLYKSFMKPPEIAPPRQTDNSGYSPVETEPPKSGNTDPAVTPTEVKTSGRKDGVYTFLLVGLDQQYGNTDTLMVGRFDSKKQEMNIVSIPRDTCANVYYGYVSSKKISAVYGIGGGIDALMEAVSDMVGFNIDSYIIVNIKAFTALVDTLGGVYFNIPYNMNYEDPKQDLYIHFKSGYQYLTGADAVKVVRWRQNSDGTVYGDIERISIQQDFLKTVAKQCMSLSNILTKFDDYINIFKTYVNTDMTVNNLAWYGRNFLKLKTEDIKFYTMPSKYNDSIKGFSYGTIYADEWLKMVNDYLNPYEDDITEDDMNIITRDEKGNLYATKGEIAGGYESFLDYKEYIASLNKGKNSGNSGKTDNKETPTDTANSDNNGTSQTETDTQVSVTDTGNKNTDAKAENTSTGADTGDDSTDTGGEASESDLGLFYTGGG